MTRPLNYIPARALLVLLAIAMAVCAPASARAADAPSPAGRSSVGAQQADLITINFVDVDISSIVRIMSDITGKNFIYDDGLKGKVTIVAPAQLTSDEALSLFVSALELKNYTLLPVSGGYRVIPLALAKQSPARVIKGTKGVRPEDSYIVRLITIEYISTQEAFTLIQPFVSRFGQATVFGSRNALLLVDSAANINKIIEILYAADTAPEEVTPDIVYIKFAQADNISRILKGELTRAGLSGKPGAGSQTINFDLRLNAVILSGASHERDYLKRFIALLDIPPPEASSRINVYYLENADAESLSKVLQSLTTQQRTRTGVPVGGTAGDMSSKASITPDSASNALIIMASPADYRSLVDVIKKLDRRPRQVFVEAMITEVTIDKALEVGAKWRLTAENSGNPVAIGGVGTVDSSTITTVMNGLAGLTLGGLGNFITVPVTAADGSTFNLTAPGFAALFSLSQFEDAVNVLSTPHILTSDNSEAEIFVGQNVPFLSSIERQSSTAGQPLLQSIERKDTGIKLTIKPKISKGDYVKLDIYQEISAISSTTTAGAADLITTKRSAKTSVVVKNEQTVVIGGLIQTRKTKNVSKVPLLGDIPLFGRLFRFNSDRTEKTNVLVFITPRIIEDFEGLEEIRSRKVEEFKGRTGAGEDMLPFEALGGGSAGSGNE
jgi:general secretion pathway protein D